MKKTIGIKAKKLMVDDHLEIGGVLFRISSLSRNFGSGRKENVVIHAYQIDQPRRRSYIHFSVRPGTLFTIYNQK